MEDGSEEKIECGGDTYVLPAALIRCVGFVLNDVLSVSAS